MVEYPGQFAYDQNFRQVHVYCPKKLNKNQSVKVPSVDFNVFYSKEKDWVWHKVQHSGVPLWVICVV